MDPLWARVLGVVSLVVVVAFAVGVPLVLKTYRRAVKTCASVPTCQARAKKVRDQSLGIVAGVAVVGSLAVGLVGAAVWGGVRMPGNYV